MSEALLVFRQREKRVSDKSNSESTVGSKTYSQLSWISLIHIVARPFCWRGSRSLFIFFFSAPSFPYERNNPEDIAMNFCQHKTGEIQMQKISKAFSFVFFFVLFCCHPIVWRTHTYSWLIFTFSRSPGATKTRTILLTLATKYNWILVNSVRCYIAASFPSTRCPHIQEGTAHCVRYRCRPNDEQHRMCIVCCTLYSVHGCNGIDLNRKRYRRLEFGTMKLNTNNAIPPVVQLTRCVYNDTQ